MSSLNPRNVRINGRRTSVRLEPDMWDALKDICAREGASRDQICSHVAGTNGRRGFTSSLRVFILNYYRGGGRPQERSTGREMVSHHRS